MRVLLFIILLIQTINMTTAQKTPHELDANYSATYAETIIFYERLAESSEYVQMVPFGMTDVGEPLHEVIISKDGIKSPQINDKRAVLFINNGIHPGEPCGIDASMAFARDVLADGQRDRLLDSIIIVIVPMYNIGGALLRNSHTRVNQEGPHEYGFRGNARNYDLNRDFLKCDTKNAQSFNLLFNKWNPHLFIDTHTSNGADYQYTMTLISTTAENLERPLAKILVTELNPYLYQDMDKRGWPMCPYVDLKEDEPSNGIVQFVDHPRYSTGYAALHHTIGFMPETHMLKPFADRVTSTYAFLQSACAWLAAHATQMIKAKKEAIARSRTLDKKTMRWKNNWDRWTDFNFKGYTAGYKKSAIHDKKRLYYDRNKPYEKNIKYYNYFIPELIGTVPDAYIIPQAYQDCIERLQWNGVEMKPLTKDTSYTVERYRIIEASAPKEPYEGHYFHRTVKTEVQKDTVVYRKGDYYISTDQDARNYIFHVLEPQSADSYFAWNFFDGILQQKEGFSAYVWEDLAEEVLNNDPALKKSFEKAKTDHPEWKENSWQALKWIYDRSPYYEKDTHRIYPVARVVK